MKKLFLLFILFVSSFAVHAAECNAQKDPMLEILSNELMRNFKTLKKQKPPVYYLSYQLRVMKELNLIAVAGDLSQNTKGSFGWLDVDARVGSTQTDNTHELKGFWNKYRLEGGVVPTDQKSRRALRHLLWRSTQKAVEKAQDDYNNGLWEIKGADTDYLTGVIGAKYAFTIESDARLQFRPELRAAATYDVMSDEALSTVVLPGSASYVVSGDRLSRFGGEFGIGLSAIYNGLEISVNYDLDLHEHYTSQTGMLKFRYDF